MDNSPIKNPPDFFAISLADSAQRLRSDLVTGLSPDEAELRLEKYGPNQFRTMGTRRPLQILFNQILNPMILLLMAVIGISLLIGHLTDAAIIAVIVLLNTGIGFFQEFRAEKAMESIRRLSVPQARVIRSGTLLNIPAQDLVIGDLVVIEAGDRIPSDLRLSEVNSLQVDESLLTGESQTVFKQTGALPCGDLSLGDQSNRGFMGTYIVGGRGKGLVTATGSATELGKIAQLVLGEKSAEVPLKRRMDRMTRWLVLVALALCSLVLGLGLLERKPWLDMLLTSISLGIAAIPEGLPAVVTISLSLGALRLSRRGVLVRRLGAVEALGSITTICADKTGTLTHNRMEVRSIFFGGKRCIASEAPVDSNVDFFSLAFVLCNDAQLPPEVSEPTGDPMEIALLNWSVLQGHEVARVRGKWPRHAELPFDSERKRMTTMHLREGKCFAFTKGAPESVLTLCRYEWIDNAPQEIDEVRRRTLGAEQERMASEGFRVLAVAMKQDDRSPDLASFEREMVLLGFVGLQDPLRQDAIKAVAGCQSAGIRAVMITGDHPATAIAIGKELGLYRDGDEVLTGQDLKKMAPDLLREKALQASIYARVSPEDKLRIIETLQASGQIVAMTGDGVNDAPALKKADVGIAMGRGTDVAKEASALILTEENFATIVRAVREGRIIYDNIRKFVRYMLTTNLGEIVTMLLAMIFVLPLPLQPVQLLWINLVTDGLPAVALGFEGAEGNVMARQPRHPKENILGRGLLPHAIWVGIAMGFLTILSLFTSWKNSGEFAIAQTIAFTSLVLMQMGHVLGIRSESRPLWKIGFLSNYRLVLAIFATILSQVLIVYVPALAKIFHTVPLKISHLSQCFLIAGLVYAMVEVEKYLRNRKELVA